MSPEKNRAESSGAQPGLNIDVSHHCYLRLLNNSLWEVSQSLRELFDLRGQSLRELFCCRTESDQVCVRTSGLSPEMNGWPHCRSSLEEMVLDLTNESEGGQLQIR